MTSSLIVKDTHPRRDFNQITQIGLKAYSLALTYQPVIDARLPGTIAALAADLDALQNAVPDALQTRHEAILATAEQNEIARQGHAQVQALRQTIRKSGASRTIQRAYGVGQVTLPRRVHQVKAALQQIVERALAAPQEAAGFGLTPADVSEMAAFITQLAGADMAQEKKRADAPLSTKERNKIANRVVQTAALIAGTGMRAFVQNPAELADFKALMASTRKPRRAKAKQSPAPAVPG